MKLWEDTPFERIADDLGSYPSLRVAYCMGKIDQQVFAIFGCNPDEPAPDAAREIAAILMHAMFTGEGYAAACKLCDDIVSNWREAAN